MSDETPTLESLTPELFALVSRQTGAVGLSRLARVSHQLGVRVQEAEDSWASVWVDETCSCKKPLAGPAREALRATTTLERVHWSSLPLPPQSSEMLSAATLQWSESMLSFAESGKLASQQEAPRWRQHACVLSCNGGESLVMFGGRDINGVLYFSDTWACDVQSGVWQQVAAHGRGPSPRCFNSDAAGGGRVLCSGDEEWAVIFGGLCQPGHRDNQTWLLGPLNEPPAEWSWLPTRPDEWMGRPPQARFHHTLTVVPRCQSTEDDFLVMVGGHNRLIQPILDMHVLSLRDATFHWPDHDRLPERRIGATVTWVAQPREPQPPARGFHVAACWTSPWCTDFLVVSCGVGTTNGGQFQGDVDGDFVTALGDTWLFDMDQSSWVQLIAQLQPPRSRAASTIVRGQVVICGGCRQESSVSLAPGEALNDVWLLDLLCAVQYDGPPAYSVSAVDQPWVRCVLPIDSAERPVHIGASAMALYGGRVLLVLGGHGRSAPADQFGDLPAETAWALHESQAVGFSGGTTLAIDHGSRWLGCHDQAASESMPRPFAAALVSRGLAHYAGEETAGEAEERVTSWLAVEGMRVLIHGLGAQAHLNGAVGTVVDRVPRAGPADARVGVQLGPPHNRGVKVRRSNLQPSTRFGEQSMVAVPDRDNPDTVVALTPSMSQSRQSRVSAELRSGIVLQRFAIM